MNASSRHAFKLWAAVLCSAAGTVQAAESTSADVAPAAAIPAHGEMSADQVARELANPNTPLARLTLKNQWTHWDGNLPGADGTGSGNVQFQPSFPFPVGERKNIFFRPSFSYLVNQPVVDAVTGEVETRSGFVDIGYDLSYGFATKTGWQFAGGVVGSFPTGADRLSNDTWTLGPEFVVAKINKTGVFGIFPNHAWDVSGPAAVSLTTIQPIAVFFLGGGWTTGTASRVQYDWEGEQWTVPLNISLSKTVKSGKTTWQFGVQVNYYAEQSDLLGPKWMIAFNITPVVPNVFAEWLGATY